MGGIFGVFARQGRGVSPGTLVELAASLGHRRASGLVIDATERSARPVCQIRNPRESAIVDTEGLVAVLDGRLDNRDWLRADLRCARADIPDVMLLIAAYRRWGRDFPARLLGDFAFALWDPAESRLLCGRDHFGVRPLYYCETADLFAFASEPAAVLTVMPSLRRTLNEEWLADFVAGLGPQPDATVFAGLARLPAAHVCAVSVNAVSRHRYYTLAPPEPTARADAPEAFADLLRSSVISRLHGSRPVGALLSGGLDSSSIVSIVAPIRHRTGNDALPTFSLVYPAHPEHDERPFIDEVLKIGHIDPVFLESDDIAPFADFGRLLANQGAPFLGPNLATSSQLYYAAARRGVGILLDGHGGDETVSHGTARLWDLAYTAHWFRLWREVKQLCATEQVPPMHVFATLLRNNGPQRRLRRVLGDARRRVTQRPASARPRWLRHLNPDFAARTSIAARRAEPPLDPRRFGREEAFQHHRAVASHLQPHAFEVIDHASASAGIEVRFPFWDKRLVEFCLSLPSSEKLGDGYTRLILRKALQGVLPERVRLRRDKLDFTPHLVRGMVTHHRDFISAMLSRNDDALARYFDLVELRQAWERLCAPDVQVDGGDVHAVWRAVSLGLWLREATAAGARVHA